MFPLFPRTTSHRSNQGRGSRGKRATRRWFVELLEDRVVPSTLDALKTVYAPGETAVLHLSGLAVGETVAIQVTRTDSGTGTPRVSPTWLATDGHVSPLHL